MASIRELIRRLRQAIGLKPVPELDYRLTGMERVFRAPPLTHELVSAIRLISPHCDFTTKEKYREIWEADQNGACWGEYEALTPLFHSMPRPPHTILEIGPGMGRSLVFFSKKLGWEGCEIHAYEGEGSTTKYTILGPRSDSYCGNINVLRYVLNYNRIRNVTIFNARNTRLADLPGPYDFLYCFYGIGFHWALDNFLDDLLPLLDNESIAVFTVPRQFTPFPRLEDLSYRIIDWKTAWPKDGYLKMLVVGKKSLPNWT
jgi:hypothetical protein